MLNILLLLVAGLVEIKLVAILSAAGEVLAVLEQQPDSTSPQARLTQLPSALAQLEQLTTREARMVLIRYLRP
jgi:hypothetical protein